MRRAMLFATLLLAACSTSEPAPEATPTPSPTAEAKKPPQPQRPKADPIPAPEDVAAAPDDATKTESGLAYKVLQAGTGDVHPTADAEVEVHYTGWMTNGEMFDSSVSRGRPAKFRLQGVIKGWTEGVQYMKVGEKTRFWIPADLAYGDTPRRPGGPHGTLVFDIELLSIKEPPPPIPAPADVKGPPSDTKTTESGLAYKHLQVGEGAKPKPTDRVKVDYTGWTTDGTMFDSSINRGRPAVFPLNRVIKGWTEGLQLMNVGGKTRFWIPAELAYGETPKRPGAPAGMLVFDIELHEIVEVKTPTVKTAPKPMVKDSPKPASK